MISLHKLNGDKFILNINHIETLEEKPDTTITLTNGRIYLVKESLNQVVQMIIEYKRAIYQNDKLV